MLIDIDWKFSNTPDKAFWYRLEQIDGCEHILMDASPESKIRVGVDGWKERPVVRRDRPGVYEHSGCPGIERVIKDCSLFRSRFSIQHFGEAGLYGVADNIEQILSAARVRPDWILPGLDFVDIDDPNRMFVLSYKTINRVDHPGWRWHKNGRYIGDYQPRHECLGDDDIDCILSYWFIELETN
jgi:hypothetical protein